MSFSENFLQGALKNFTLTKHYQQKVRHYTLYEHTLLVLMQYECYFAPLHKTSLTQFFRYLIVFHDIGKPQAEQMRKRNLQHKFTCQMLLQMKNDLPFSEKQFKIVISLLETDVLSEYLRGKTPLNTTLQTLAAQAKKAGIPLHQFLQLSTIYYQCDVGSYTKDAGGLPYLEHLFQYEEGQKLFSKKYMRLIFSQSIEQKYLTLKNKISS
jgi:hypothetical protein